MAKSFADQAGDYIGDTVRSASQFGAVAADAVKEGVSTAGRAISDTRDAAEDFLDETKRRAKRHPIESILLSLAIGVAFGFILGRATSND
jgi:hypothetical protein